MSRFRARRAEADEAGGPGLVIRSTLATRTAQSSLRHRRTAAAGRFIVPARGRTSGPAPAHSGSVVRAPLHYDLSAPVSRHHVVRNLVPPLGGGGERDGALRQMSPV